MSAAFHPNTIPPQRISDILSYPGTICRSYPGEMGIALHYRAPVKQKKQSGLTG